MSHLPSKQALCSHPLGQSWPLSPRGLALGMFCGEEDGVWHGGIPIPATTLHGNMAPHSLGKPRREASGRDGFGDALPLAAVFWIPERAGPSCPASSTSKMLPGWGPCRLLQRRRSPAPGEGLPWWREPLSHQSPLRGGGSPHSVLV